VKTLPDHLELIGADLERAARGLANKRRQRSRRIQVAALVAATAVIGTGVALAARGVDLLAWIRSDDPSEVRYLIDTNATYRGPAPAALDCASATGETFTCERGRDGGEIECTMLRKGQYPCGELGRSQRVYRLSQRVEAAPVQTREDFLQGVDESEQKGLITETRAEDFRDAIDDVDDSFFVKWQRLNQVGGFDTFVEGPGSTELVPPQGIPMFATCEASEGAFRCRDLAEAVSLPVGSPVYQLEPTEDWVAIPREDRSAERWAAFEALWGGPMSEEEARLFFFLSEAVLTTGEGGGGVEVETGVVTEGSQP
jgi:hypothetical protein